MLFSSLIFLFFFLPLNLLVYYISPRQFRNYILLIFSIGFYAWGGVSYASILILSILVNFVVVRLLAKSIRHRKKWMVIGLSFNIILILVFKYLDFFIENINGIGDFVSSDYEGFSKAHIILPLGISFFTFQQMSLMWDVYRNP